MAGKHVGLAAEAGAALAGLVTAEAAELASVTTRLAGTQDQLAIIVAGQTYAMPVTLQPLTGGEFAFSAESKNQALHVQRLLQ